MTLKRLIVVLLIILIPPLLVLIYLPSWTHYNELKQEDERLRHQLEELQETNRKLQEQEYLLKNDVRYLEQVLREELNVVRPDEVVYKLVPEEEEKKPESKTAQA